MFDRMINNTGGMIKNSQSALDSTKGPRDYAQNIMDEFHQNSKNYKSRWGEFLFGPLEGPVTDVYHRATGIPTEDEKRNAARAVSDQIQAYKDQTELTRKELVTKQDEVKAEKRRVEEKQIRQLRRNYGGGSLLGTQQTNEADMSNKLGG